MKRILAMLCVIACLFALAVPALAANTVTVHAYVPEGWSDVRVWAWDDNDKNPTSADWPGDIVMTKGADGWYTVEVPYGYANMLINANNGGVQTDDVKGIDLSKEIWIVCGDRSHEYYTSKPANVNVGGGNNNGGNNDGGNAGGAGIDVSALNSMALVGTGIPGVGEWNPGDAAGDMTKVSDGVFSKVIAVTAGTSMQFKLAANDIWDGGANLGAAEEGVVVALGKKVDLINDGGSKDLSLTAAKDCNLKFTLTIANGAASLLVEETTEEPSTNPGGGSAGAPVDGPTVTVYAKVPADWKDVRVWCWTDSNGNPSNQGDWPGNFTMTKGDDGWYSVEIPQGYPNLLISGNNGSAQTADITGALGTTPVYIDALTNPQQPTVHNEKVDIAEPDPTEPVAPTKPIVRPSEPAGSNNEGGNKAAGSDNTVLLCIIGSVVIIAVAAVVVIILKKKQA